MITEQLEAVVSLSLARNPDQRVNQEAAEQLDALKSRLANAEKVIAGLVRWIVELEESGDNGQWYVEDMKEVKAACTFLPKNLAKSVFRHAKQEHSK